MKKIFLLAATVALLTACTREPLFEMRELSNEAAKAKKLKEEVNVAKAIQWKIEPVSSNPLRFRTVLSLQLNNWDKLKKEASKANWNYLQLSVEGTPITIDSKEEFSQPTNNKFTLLFNRIDLETGIVYFENKEQAFSLLFPENSYALASARLLVKYQTRINDAKVNGLEEIFKATARIKPGDVTAYGIEEPTIVHEPIIRVRMGNPYRVDVFNPANGITTGFVMYAADPKYIQYLFDNSKQAGKGKLTILPIKETKGLPEVQCYFNVETLQLISLESKDFVFCSFGDKPPLGGDEDGGVAKQDGRGTRSSTSTAQTKPSLL